MPGSDRREQIGIAFFRSLLIWGKYFELQLFHHMYKLKFTFNEKKEHVDLSESTVRSNRLLAL